jgi:transketolase
MAVTARWLAHHFNRPGFKIFDYDVYALCGDGDMMEGVTSEAASFAGHQMLGNLCWLYDSNRVTIEGHTDLAFSDDVAARFLAYGWNVQQVGDANDTEKLARAIETFRRTPDVPTLIIVDSHIGYGAPHKHDTSSAHGEPLGEEEVRDEVTLLYLSDHQVRHVRMNRPHSAQPVPTWQGESVGHYEGDALVIDTIGQKVGPLAMVDRFGTPYSAALHVIEQPRR